jgi:hypothetical protein
MRHIMLLIAVAWLIGQGCEPAAPRPVPPEVAAARARHAAAPICWDQGRVCYSRDWQPDK